MSNQGVLSLWNDESADNAGGITNIRCISLWQPWASLMVTVISRACDRCHGTVTASLPFQRCTVCGGGGFIERVAKNVETRHWWTDVRGTVAIHAAKTLQGYKDCEGMAIEHVVAMERALQISRHEWKQRLPRGAVIGEGELVDCLPADEALRRFPDQEPFGNFAPGRYGHIYENLRAVGPHPFKGLQGFFYAAYPAAIAQNTPTDQNHAS